MQIGLDRAKLTTKGNRVGIEVDLDLERAGGLELYDQNTHKTHEELK